MSYFSKIYREYFFILSKPKLVYLRPFLPFSQLSKFLKHNFVYFGHKHVETGPNCSHELDTFLEYHMPLSCVKLVFERGLVSLLFILMSLYVYSRVEILSWR